MMPMHFARSKSLSASSYPFHFLFGFARVDCLLLQTCHVRNHLTRHRLYGACTLFSASAMWNDNSTSMTVVANVGGKLKRERKSIALRFREQPNKAQMKKTQAKWKTRFCVSRMIALRCTTEIFISPWTKRRAVRASEIPVLCIFFTLLFFVM